jgi:hypothetical protein
MKMVLRSAVGLCLVLTVGGAFGITQDPVWMFSDNGLVFYQYFRYCDTARHENYLCFALESDQIPDTGDSYDESKYINFDYQFSGDSFYIKDEFDSSIIHYSFCRPGFAGFKTAWDYGMTGFPVARYKYLVLAHKGPLANHKVTVTCWYNDGQCGSPSFNETLGTFDASETWKVDTIVIPDSVQNKPDKERNFSKYYELVFLINNLDPNDTSSSPPGCLKVDEIRLVGCNPIDSSPQPQTVNEGGSATFLVATSKANSEDVFTYQWKKDGTDIAGATDSFYTVASAAPEHEGVYSVAVTVSSTGLTFTSQGAALTLGTGVIAENLREIDKKSFSPAENPSRECGCGNGVGLALIPPICFRAVVGRRRKKRKNRRLP